MKRLLLSLMLMLLAACATTPRVNTDFNPQADFNAIKTYRWLAQPQGMSPLVAGRVMAAVDSQLEARGWQRVESGGDAIVAAGAVIRQQQTVDTFYSAPMYSGWGRSGPWRGHHSSFGTRQTTVRTFDVGTLVVDIFSASNQQGIWRGTAQQTVPSTPERTSAAVEAGVRGMFEGFPPGTMPLN